MPGRVGARRRCPATAEAKGTSTAVLIAIAIPVFTNQLEKAREATDAANLRSTYAEVMAAVLTETKAGKTDNGVTITVKDGIVTATKSYDLQQQQKDWQSEAPKIGDLTLTNAEADPSSKTIAITATSAGGVQIGSVKNAVASKV